MLGRGGFSFRNESLDLAFRADGKKFSLFSGQSPVGIGGTFARPGIDVISPELVARGGAAAALGIAARTEERRVGKECVSTCRSRWSPYNKKKNTAINAQRKITIN